MRTFMLLEVTPHAVMISVAPFYKNFGPYSEARAKQSYVMVVVEGSFVQKCLLCIGMELGCHSGKLSQAANFHIYVQMRRQSH